jgi:putative hydrolase of HD superfamily
MSSLDQLIDFVKFTHEIRNVRRAMIFEDARHENDAEHGYQLALVAWFLVDNDNLNLNKYKAIGLAIVHDIAEAYAGDTTAFANAKDRAEQARREKRAIEKLKESWPTFTSLHDLIEEYEVGITTEAKFVSALDKLLPMINNYIFEGKAWKEQGITLNRVKEIKLGKIDISPEINEYYKDILKILEQKPELFGVKNEGL